MTQCICCGEDTEDEICLDCQEEGRIWRVVIWGGYLVVLLLAGLWAYQTWGMP